MTRDSDGPRVLMVTGAYHPETSGASLQCRQLIRLLRGRAEFLVLTTTTEPSLAAKDRVDDTEVWRVLVDPTSAASKATAAMRLGTAFTRLRDRFDIVHLHGFSQKTMLVMAMARAFGKRIAIKLTSFGHDDALSMRRRGMAAFEFYQRADRFIGVSPQFEAAHRAAGLAPERYVSVPNGVDLERFRPASADERRRARQSLGLDTNRPVVLFVGFFSHEKRPDVLYQAWADVSELGVASTLLLVGPTRSTYYEIDSAMAEVIRHDAATRGLLERIVFVEHTHVIERCYQASDVFVLPTLREGMPNVVLESMASAVPPVVTNLAGVTDWIIDDGTTGVLVAANDRPALAAAMIDLLNDQRRREAMGRSARASVEARFSASRTADLTLALYQLLLADSESLIPSP
jgi:glycosyltransferase involved in cell wall biosynthesis